MRSILNFFVAVKNHMATQVIVMTFSGFGILVVFFTGVFSSSFNTVTSKAIIVNESLIPNYFNKNVSQGIPVYYIVPEIVNSSRSKVVSNIEQNNKSGALIIDFTNIQYSNCITDMPYHFSLTNDIPQRIINYTPKFNECLEQAFKNTIIGYLDIELINSNPVINEYKNSNKKLSNLINQIKSEQKLSTYDAIQIYVLAYQAKANSEIKKL